jgi:cytochrome P450
MHLGAVDLSNEDVFVEAVPHAYFRFLRENAPVSWQPSVEGGGFWSVVRYDDIARVEKDVATFSSRTNVSPREVPPEVMAATLDHLVIQTDPPRHTALRMAMAPYFTPKALSGLEGRIRDVTTDAIDAVIEQGACDWLDVAAYIPIEIVADLMGVPAQDRSKTFDWANAMFGSSDPELAGREGSHQAAMEMFFYSLGLSAKYRAAPEANAFSRLANAEVDGALLSDQDMGAAFLVLATAGNETTRTSLLHGVQALIDHPDVAAALRADRSLIPNFVEEQLRLYAPVNCMARVAVADAVIGDQAIKAGDRVVMWYASANRDAAVFDDPDTFDLARRNARENVAFGARGGIHYCLGAMLARMELRIAFEEILDRLHDIAPAGPVRRLRSNFTNGVKAMPIRFSPGARKGTQRVTLYATKRHGVDPS